MIKKLLTSLGLTLWAVLALAQGQEAMTFSRTMRDPIKAAMAGSDLISTDNVAFAWEGNAASLPFSPNTMDAALSYASWAPKSLSSNNLAFGAGAAFAERFGVSAGFALDRYSALGDAYSDFSPENMVASLAAGVKISDMLSAGVSCMYLKQRLLSDVAYNAFSLSANLLWRISPSFDAAAAVANLGSKISDKAGNSFSQPASIRAGVQYRISSLKANLGGDWFFSGNYSAAVGAEYGIADIFFLRAGYRYSSAGAVVPSHLALGAGIQFKGIHLDFTYLTAGEALANTIVAGLGFRF